MPKTIFVRHGRLHYFIREVLKRLRLPAPHASRVGDALVAADLAGVEGEGSSRLPLFASRIGSGLINPAADIRMLYQEQGTAVVDGDNGMGHVVGARSMEIAIEMAKKLGVEMKFNTEANAKFMRSVLHQYDVCIVASGARIDMDAYAGIEGRERLLDALDVAHGRKQAGKRVVIIGGGKIGLVLGESLRKAGAEVVIVERDKRIGGDVMPTFKWRHTTWVEELGIAVHTSSRLKRVTAEGALIVDAKGKETLLLADSVIAAGPRKANQELFAEFEWMVDELHGCGDALMPRGIDAAIHEGYRLGVRI